MLHLVIERRYKDFYSNDVFIGVFETKELAEDCIKQAIEQHKRCIKAMNDDTISKCDCTICDVYTNGCNCCFIKVDETDDGFKADGYYFNSCQYIIKEVELNKRID